MKMDFTSPEYYLWFLPMVILGVLVFSRGKKNIQLGLILIFNYIFFLLASGWHIILLMTSTILDWKIANRILGKKSDKKKENDY